MKIEQHRDIQTTDEVQTDDPKVAQTIGDICELCVRANISLLIQIDGRQFQVGVAPSEDTEESSIVFNSADDFLASFQQLRMSGVAKAFLDQRMDVRGDIHTVIEMANQLENPKYSFRERLRAVLLNQMSRFAPITAAPEHYNLPPEAFEQFLGKWQKYTCNYYPTGDETLSEAEEAAMALSCKDFLDVPEGGDHLEIGCGWGGQMEYIHKHCGANVVGITDCPTQAAYTRERLKKIGIKNPDVRVSDFADNPIEQNGYDTVSAVGCLEHIQPARHAEFFSFIHRALKSNGRLFVQSITRPYYKPNRKGERDGTRFLNQHVFPGYQLANDSQIIKAAHKNGLHGEFDKMRSHGSHYAKTLRDWADNLVAQKEQVVAMVGEKQYRILLAYIAMGRKAFEEGAVELNRFTFVKSLRLISVGHKGDRLIDRLRGIGTFMTEFDYQCRRDEGLCSDQPPLPHRIILAKKGPRQREHDRTWGEGNSFSLH